MKKKTTPNYQLIRRDEHLLDQREKHLGILTFSNQISIRARFMVSVAAGDKKTPRHTNKRSIGCSA